MKKENDTMKQLQFPKCSKMQRVPTHPPISRLHVCSDEDAGKDGGGCCAGCGPAMLCGMRCNAKAKQMLLYGMRVTTSVLVATKVAVGKKD